MVSSSPRLKTVMNPRLSAEARSVEIVDQAPRSTLPAEYAADPFLIPSEIAKWEKVDPKTVTRWVKRGIFGEAPNVITLPGGTHRRIRKSAYDRAKEEIASRYAG